MNRDDRDGVRLEHDWLDASLPANVTIGEGSWLYSAFAFIHYQSRQRVGVRIGRSCGVYNGSFFEVGPNGTIDIGDYCSIVGATIVTNGRVAIGDYAFIAHEVLIADHAFARPPSESSAARAIITVGSDVWIGAGAAIIGNISVGDGAIVAARAVVQEDVPPMSLVAGNPAKVVRRLEAP